MNVTEQLADKVKKASKDIALASTNDKNQLLLAIGQSLLEDSKMIIDQNKKDIEQAKYNRITEVMIDRLMINQERIQAMVNGIFKVVKLEDPIGVIQLKKELPNGLKLNKITVPLGVIGMIYESRPNVTVDAAILCLKAGNAVVLRGGKEAINTNKALVTIMQKTIKSYGLNPYIIGLIEDTTRKSAIELMKAHQYLDVLIPRGGARLIQTVVENSSVPVIETGVGNCHIYVEKSADVAKAINIVDNAKTSRPSVCNACETLLVDEAIAKEFLPLMFERFKQKNVKVVGCQKTITVLGSDITLATDEDYFNEFLDYKIAVKIVKNMQEAIKHIDDYSSHHSEAILTEDTKKSSHFVCAVDSAAVYVNASTRFTDGEEFGLGAEIGISTQKLHARGPMGLNALTSYKYIIYGDGQIR